LYLRESEIQTKAKKSMSIGHFFTMIDDDVRKICQRKLVSDSFDSYLENKICLKTKDRKQKKEIVKEMIQMKRSI
jgi:hypothetical protein